MSLTGERHELYRMMIDETGASKPEEWDAIEREIDRMDENEVLRALKGEPDPDEVIAFLNEQEMSIQNAPEATETATESTIASEPNPDPPEAEEAVRAPNAAIPRYTGAFNRKHLMPPEGYRESQTIEELLEFDGNESDDQLWYKGIRQNTWEHLVSASHKGKSTLVIYRAACLCHPDIKFIGGEEYGQRIYKHGAVMILSLEADPKFVARMIRKIHIAHGVDPAKAFPVLVRPAFKLDSEPDIAGIQYEIEKHDIIWLALDTKTAATPEGSDGDSITVAQRTGTVARKWCSTGRCAVTVVSHMTKAEADLVDVAPRIESVRGSGEGGAASDYVTFLTATSESPGKGAQHRVILSVVKDRPKQMAYGSWKLDFYKETKNVPVTADDGEVVDDGDSETVALDILFRGEHIFKSGAGAKPNDSIPDLAKKILRAVKANPDCYVKKDLQCYKKDEDGENLPDQVKVVYDISANQTRTGKLIDFMVEIGVLECNGYKLRVGKQELIEEVSDESFKTFITP